MGDHTVFPRLGNWRQHRRVKQCVFKTLHVQDFILMLKHITSATFCHQAAWMWFTLRLFTYTGVNIASKIYQNTDAHYQQTQRAYGGLRCFRRCKVKYVDLTTSLTQQHRRSIKSAWAPDISVIGSEVDQTSAPTLCCWVTVKVCGVMLTFDLSDINCHHFISVKKGHKERAVWETGPVRSRWPWPFHHQTAAGSSSSQTDCLFQVWRKFTACILEMNQPPENRMPLDAGVASTEVRPLLIPPQRCAATRVVGHRLILSFRRNWFLSSMCRYLLTTLPKVFTSIFNFESTHWCLGDGSGLFAARQQRWWRSLTIGLVYLSQSFSRTSCCSHVCLLRCTPLFKNEWLHNERIALNCCETRLASPVFSLNCLMFFSRCNMKTFVWTLNPLPRTRWAEPPAVFRQAQTRKRPW